MERCDTLEIMVEEKLYWLGFSAFPGIGPLRFKLLRHYFGSARRAWDASYKDLVKIHLGEKLAAQFIHFRNDFSLVNYSKSLSQKNIKYITLEDVHYPALLSQISDAPFVLYIKGRKTEKHWDISRAIGVVGTRMITNYGRQVTEKLTSGLVAQGFTIISGMAYGVDALAHQTAIDNGGKTIAVLGCGVDLIRPVSNTKLYHAILDGKGAVVSEFPPGMESSKGLFPARNRIISGLSLGIVVTEGAADSGALITAGYAAQQGREVFAVPGPITSSLSQGPMKLLKQGAKMVTDVEDVLEELKLSNQPINQSTNQLVEEKIKNLTKEEKKILELLQHENLHFDEIVRKSKLSSSQLATFLTLLEMKLVVKNVGNGVYGLL